MKTALALVLLSMVVTGFCAVSQPPQAMFKLAPPPSFKRHLVVSAANGDPNAEFPEEIFRVNRKLAKAGDSEAAFELGLAYMQGIGVAQDTTQAEYWLAIGAVKPSDKELLAEFYVDGDWLPQDAAKAEHWFRSAGRPGDLFELAEMYRKAIPSQVTSAAQIYRLLLQQTGHPEVRRAQMELGKFVLDGVYSAGDDAASRALNLTWARSIAQEFLGQSDYNIAVDFVVGRESVPKSEVMWERYCERAAAYNIDLAQQFFGHAILDGQIKGGGPEEGYAWIKLASDKQYSNRTVVAGLEANMGADEKLEADQAYQRFLDTRERDGAYYRASDPLREPSETALAAMSQDDPDVMVRRAFLLGSKGTPEGYAEALALYRRVRDTSLMAAMGVLGRAYMMGTDGVPHDPALAALWLRRSVEAGYHPAALMLARLYGGEGGGAEDPAQARAWQMIGSGEGSANTQASGLTSDQETLARRQYEAWVAAHPGWAPDGK